MVCDTAALLASLLLLLHTGTISNSVPPFGSTQDTTQHTFRHRSAHRPPALRARVWLLLSIMSNTSSLTSSGEVPIQTYLTQAEGFALALSKSAVSAFESRCAITKSECEGLHYSACQSRLTDAECGTTGVTSEKCSDAGCGSVQDFSRPVGEQLFDQHHHQCCYSTTTAVRRMCVLLNIHRHSFLVFSCVPTRIELY